MNSLLRNKILASINWSDLLDTPKGASVALSMSPKMSDKVDALEAQIERLEGVLEDLKQDI